MTVEARNTRCSFLFHEQTEQSKRGGKLVAFRLSYQLFVAYLTHDTQQAPKTTQSTCTHIMLLLLVFASLITLSTQQTSLKESPYSCPFKGYSSEITQKNDGKLKPWCLPDSYDVEKPPFKRNSNNNSHAILKLK